MILHLKHDEIDKGKWDKCISGTPGAKPYGYSWYLDIMAPGWEALVADDYNAVFPLPLFIKYGIKYVTTPVFLQQLGVFTPDKSEQEKINEFLEYMPESYRLIDLRIGQFTDHKAFTVTELTNFELDLSLSYDNLRQNFSRRSKKDIEKSGRLIHGIVNDVSPEELIDLFRNNTGKELKVIKERNYDRLRKLMDFCIRNNKGKIIGVRSHNNRLIFGRFILTTMGRVTLLFTASTHESREKRISYYVLNEIIREYSSTKTILDFEGSTIPSIAAFMKSFGCVNVPYYRIYRNRLPWIIKGIRALRR